METLDIPGAESNWTMVNQLNCLIKTILLLQYPANVRYDFVVSLDRKANMRNLLIRSNYLATDPIKYVRDWMSITEGYSQAATLDESGYYYFQMGQSNFVLGDVDKAIEAYEKGMELVDNLDNVYVPEMIMSLAKAYTAKRRVDDALNFLEKYVKYYNTAKFQFEYAELLRKNNQVLKALAMYIKVTTMQDVETIGENLITCYGCIISIYESMGNKEMAELFHNQFLQCVAEKERIVNS